MPGDSPCISDEELQRLIRGQVTSERQAQLEQHLSHCEACQRRIDRASGSLSCQPAAETSSAALQRTVDQLLQSPPTNNAVEDPSTALLRRFTFLQPADDSQFPARLGKYGILRVLGQGGMGAVFAARDTTLDREVALKVPYTAEAAADELRQRFLREARAIAALNHDNIVTVYSVEEADRLLFLTMELTDGQSLSDALDAAEPLAWEDQLAVARDSAAGLAAAHAQGIVHRDVKPSNILKDRSTGRYKLSDFGLARTRVDPAITASGVLTGTPEYMSPEQVHQQQAMPQSDLFSLGIVLYQCATGVSPFRAETVLGSLARIAEHMPADPRELNPDLPAWYADLITGLLQKDLNHRPASAAALLSLLEQHVAAEPNSATRRTVFSAEDSRSAARTVRPDVHTPPDQATTPRLRPPRRRIRFAIPIVAVTVLVAGLVAIVPGLWPEDSDDGGSTTSFTRGGDTGTLNGFQIEGHGQILGALSEAIGLAGADERILVHGDGPFPVHALTLPDHPVSIVAAAGSTPVFIADTDRETTDAELIQATATLTLEGLDIRWGSRSDPDRPLMELARSSVIGMDGGMLELINCRITAFDSTCCIQSRAGNIRLTNSHLVADQGACVAWNAEDNRLDATNCVLEGGRVGVAIKGRSVLDLSRCSFGVPTGFVAYLAPQQIKDFKIRQCAFDISRLLYLTSESAAVAFDMPLQRRLMMATRMVHWHDDRNVYLTNTLYLSRGDSDRVVPDPLVATFSDWMLLWRITPVTSLESDFAVPADTSAAHDDPLSSVRNPAEELTVPVGANLKQVGPQPTSSR